MTIFDGIPIERIIRPSAGARTLPSTVGMAPGRISLVLWENTKARMALPA